MVMDLIERAEALEAEVRQVFKQYDLDGSGDIDEVRVFPPPAPAGGEEMVPPSGACCRVPPLQDGPPHQSKAERGRRRGRGGGGGHPGVSGRRPRPRQKGTAILPPVCPPPRPRLRRVRRS